MHPPEIGEPEAGTEPVSRGGCGMDWTSPVDDGIEYGLFASAEDYDSTGILTGVDPCESRYWWMPELHASLEGPRAVRHADAVERPVRGTHAASTHAARRAGSRSTAAA